MSIRTSPWPAGVPCWADLAAPDVAAVKTFYADVLGWGFREDEDATGGYAVAVRAGHAAAGIGPLPAGSNPVWTLYLAADDADSAAAAVAVAGGTVLVTPGDVGASGRMFLAADPSGALFGVWQAGARIGAEVVNEPGGLIWEDLRSTDPAAARAFYGAVFGYEFAAIPMAGPDYRTFARPGQPAAPYGGMGGLMGGDGPSRWLVYFGVDDVAGACSAAVAGGGRVERAPWESPYGRMAALVDPVGAAFLVIHATREQA